MVTVKMLMAPPPAPARRFQFQLQFQLRSAPGPDQKTGTQTRTRTGLHTVRAATVAERSKSQSSKSVGARAAKRKCSVVLRAVPESATTTAQSAAEAHSPEEKDFGFKRNLEERYEVADPAFTPPLGAGAYGIVRLARERSTGRAYAVKTISKTPRKIGAPLPPYWNKIQLEVEIMKHIGPSLNIVYLYDVFEDNSSVHLVLEIMRGGDLWKRITPGEYSERFAAGVLRSMLRTVSQCHTRHVIYRDIKPDNFLFESDEPDAPLKATDFGLAAYFVEGENLTRLCGTPSYMAPEVIRKNYGPSADLWSCGVVAYQLLTGTLPFGDEINVRPTAQVVMRNIIDKDVPLDNPALDDVSPLAKDFVSKLLTKDPDARMTAREALEHPWVREDGNEAPDTPLRGSVVRRLQRYATTGVLKRAVLRLLVEAAPSSLIGRVDELRGLFGDFDADASGSLTTDELEVGLREAGYQISAAEVGQLLHSVDTDGSGRIEYPELAAALLDWRDLKTNVLGRAKFVDWAMKAFELLDRDGNGVIDVQELAQLVCTPEDTEESCNLAVAQAIREADLDGDGCVDREEFLSLMLSGDDDSLDQYDARLLGAKYKG